MIDKAHNPALENEHRSFVHQVIGFIEFFLAFPLAIWFLFTLILPTVFNIAKHGDGFMQVCQRSCSFERSIAGLLAPEIAIGDHQLVAEAWTYRSGENVARALIPGDREGLFLKDRDVAAAQQDQALMAAGQAPPPTTERADSSDRVVKGVSGKLHGWLADKFFPMQRIFLTVTVARSWQALEMLPIFLGLGVVAWLYGAYLARYRDQIGVTALPWRFSFYMKRLRLLVATIPTVLILPLPFPAFAVLLVMFTFIVVLITLCRSHMVVQL